MTLDELDILIKELCAIGVVRLDAVQSAGYTRAQKWLAQLEDGRKVFVKNAVDSYTAQKLRDEYAICQAQQAWFMPRLLGWRDLGMPVMIREAVQGHWPPPWSADQVDTFSNFLSDIQQLQPKPQLPAIGEVQGFTGWSSIAEYPEKFMRIAGLKASWRQKILPQLVELEAQAVTGGNHLLHLDLRGDNICFTPDGVMMVDWDHGCKGNPAIDRLMWLVALSLEGSSWPERNPPRDAPLLAALCGFWARELTTPVPIGLSPRIRQLQSQQYAVAWRWLRVSLRQ